MGGYEWLDLNMTGPFCLLPKISLSVSLTESQVYILYIHTYIYDDEKIRIVEMELEFHGSCKRKG